MGKTYKFVDHLHPEPLPLSEIRRLYRGWWVFLTNVTFSATKELLSGRPAVIGVRQYDGAFDNIYDRFDAPEYGEVTRNSRAYSYHSQSRAIMILPSFAKIAH